MNNYFDNLNPEQIKAVTTTNGPVLTLSGAGTGKTRVLTARIAHILHNNLAYPWQILALTFTNKAANEMRNRIATFIDSGVKDIWMGTFHSVCLRILQSNCNLVGLQQNILIYDEDDQKALLKNVISNMGLDIKQYVPSEWVDIISRIKDSGNINYKTLSPTTKKIIESYNAELKKVNAIDFGDIILYVLQLFQDNQDLLQKYQNQFKYILIDEFQDTNSAQMMFLKLLTKDKQNPNIFCVGDDDQSIYSWRGAEIKN
ncbi:MAG: UvrD-helicase domain-containing protein, partial [Alphaproteobacteria bacterium]|nr:UvrD-helicase domain-containing protein [Alphaproteobacteria bacterium]